MSKRIVSFLIIVLLCGYSWQALALPPKGTKTEKNVEIDGVFIDKETGLSFRVPDGWQRSNLSRDDYTALRVKYIPSDHGNAMIMYSYKDLWAVLPETTWMSLGYQRREMIDQMSSEDLCDLMGLSTDGVNRLEESWVNNKRILNYELMVEGMPYPILYKLIIHNGGLFMLQYYSFFPSEKDPYCEAFDKLVESIAFDR